MKVRRGGEAGCRHWLGRYFQDRPIGGEGWSDVADASKCSHICTLQPHPCLFISVVALRVGVVAFSSIPTWLSVGLQSSSQRLIDIDVHIHVSVYTNLAFNKGSFDRAVSAAPFLIDQNTWGVDADR